MAQDHPGPVRLGRQLKEGRLSPGAVPAPGARRGPKKAICAVAASILTAAYHMLRDGTFYQDLGPDHLSRRAKGDRTVRLVRHLTALGYTVQPPAQLASA